LRLINLNDEAVCKLCFLSTYQDKFSKDFFGKKSFFKLGCLHHVLCLSASEWLVELVYRDEKRITFLEFLNRLTHLWKMS